MLRSFFVLALLATLTPGPAQACVCEDAWAQTADHVWHGQALDEIQLDGRTCLELRYLRDTVYARHGYTFTAPWVVQQFQGDPRYVIDEFVNDETVERMMTPADRNNVDLVVEAEVNGNCYHWWRENGDSVKDLIVAPRQSVTIEEIDPLPTARVVEVPIEEPKPGYVQIQEMYVGADGIAYLTIGEANPTLLIDRALDGKVIENEWLAPRSCDELSRVEDALYARYHVDFGDSADEAFFADATIGIYTPEPGRTRYMAEALHFRSVDKLTLLRIDRAQDNKHCEVE